MRAVIVAGGLATRMNGVAKAMLRIAGKPLLAHHLDALAAAGVEDVTICAGHRAEALSLDRTHARLNVRLIIDAQPLGSGGCIAAACAAGEGDLLVIFGDVMADLDCKRLLAHHQAQRAEATLVVHATDHPHDSDLVEADARGLITAMHRKPHRRTRGLANAGIFVLSERFVRAIDTSGKRDLVHDVLFPAFARGARLAAYETSEYLKDVGTPERYAAAARAWDGPLVSVITNCFNDARYLRDNVASVRAQRYRNYEHLVIDCGSSDDSLAVLAEVAHPRLRVLSVPRCGLSAARNQAIRAARGELVAILDADDRALPDRVAAPAALFARDPQLVVACGAIEHANETTGAVRHYVFPREHRPLRMLLEAAINPVSCPTATFRREAFLRAGGYDERFRHAEDYELLLRLRRIGNFASIREPRATSPRSRSMTPPRLLPRARRAGGATPRPPNVPRATGSERTREVARHRRRRVHRQPLRRSPHRTRR